MTVTPAIHKRKYQDGDDVPLDELKAVLPTAARAAQMDVQFLPLFERLEREIAERERRQATLDRARAIAAGAMGVSPAP
jgi:hypothetical protein